MAEAAYFSKALSTPASKALGDPLCARKWVSALRAGRRMEGINTRHKQHRLFPLCNAESQDKSSGLGSAVEERPVDTQDDVDNLMDPAPGGLSSWLYPPKEELPDDVEMNLFDHLNELRDRILVSVAVVGVAIIGCFAVAKDLVVFLEAPVYSQGVRFLQLSPGEYFFTTIKVSGYSGLLLGSPVILYEIIAFVLPGLTRSERKFLGPIVFGSSILFYTGLAFSYGVLAPAALKFFVSYAEGAVESLWSIDQYFEFVLVLMFSTGLAFQVFRSQMVRGLLDIGVNQHPCSSCIKGKQHRKPFSKKASRRASQPLELWICVDLCNRLHLEVPVIQLLLGQTRLISGDQMLSVWRYVVVGAVTAAAVLTPSTDPLTQILLAGPLIALYFGGAFLVKWIVPESESS